MRSRRLLPLLSLAFTTTAHALPEVRSTSEVESGTLLFRGDSAYLAAPAVRTRASIRVTGLIARTEVVQEFTNPGATRAEGLYVFPLPEGAAVDRLRLQIGDRTIEGEIQEKEAAARAYEQAKAEGKKASLLEQARPNVFSTAVANVGPGERVRVRIEYQETLRYDDGRFGLRFPLIVNPGHYQPPVELSGFNGNGFAEYTPSVPLPTPSVPALDAEIVVDLEPGFELAELTSASHPISIAKDGEHHVVTLSGGAVVPDRDFVLAWAPAPSQRPRAALFSERFGDARYALLMLTPPRAIADATAQLPRETVFIIDTSGSMEGPSMEQAKQALTLAIDRLRDQDRFEVIRFSDGAQALFGDSVQASASARAKARGFVAGLRANGGTNMVSALELALAAGVRDRALRQVVFITDGAVGNERELYRMIEERLGKSRLFTVGIGAAPNSWFMREAAQFGRGTFTFIGRVDEVERQMGALFAKIASPVVSDLQLDFDGEGAEAWPDRIPDLYAGEPILTAVRLGGAAKKVVVRGTTGGAPFTVELPVAGGAEERGIHKLWARAKIEALEDRVVLGTPEEEVKPAITAVALQHHLVSKYTSLVAIDRAPELVEATPDVPAYAAAMPSTATPAELCLWIACALGLLGLAAMRVERRAS